MNIIKTQNKYSQNALESDIVIYFVSLLIWNLRLAKYINNKLVKTNKPKGAKIPAKNEL